MATVLLLLGGISALVALAVAVVLRRAREYRLLVQDGVDATGVVVDKPRFGRVVTAKKNRHLRYRYRDAFGGEHTHRVRVADSLYDAHVEGGPIEIVYSRSRPEVSAPKALVDAARAVAKK